MIGNERPYPSRVGPIALRLAVLLLAMLLPACHKEDAPPAEAHARSTSELPPRQPGMLVDVTKPAGIDFVHDPLMRGGYLFPEVAGSGCGFVDVDNDDLLDIYLIQSGRDLTDPSAPAKPNRLYRNRGDGTFEDITESSGAGDTGYGQGMAIGDIDNDGDNDIYIQNVGPDVLLRNNGEGTFTDVTKQAGLGHPGWGIGCGFSDFDRDGRLDIFVANYVAWSVETDVKCEFEGHRDYCSPEAYHPTADVIYRNNGDGTFTDVTADSGIADEPGPGMSAICADFDDDGLIDVYIANDTFPNRLWRNRGDWKFENVALTRGCAFNGQGLEEASMGCNAEDFDLDGDLDLFMCSYYGETQTLYLNQQHYFDDVTLPTRLGALTLRDTSFGACMLHLWNDHRRVIYIGNGAAVEQTGTEPPEADRPLTLYDMVLEWSAEDHRFTDITATLGPAMQVLEVSRGVATGDYDNDGDVDVLISNNNGPARLLRNDAAAGNRWFMVRVAGRYGARDAIGAKVFVTIGDTTYRRDVIVNYSYASTCDTRLHFGLGEAAQVDTLVIEWPGGQRRTWTALPADQVFVARHDDPLGE